MGFGFGNTDEEEVQTKPEIEYKWSDRLISTDWDKFTVGMKVRSVLTGNEGTIVNLSEEYFMIKIEWDNGKVTHTSHKYYDKVIVI